MKFLPALVALGVMITEVQARDLGQWANSDPTISTWFRNLMQPDTYPQPKSCCGESDGYWADEVHVDGDKVYAVITDRRDDGPLRREHEDPGTRFLVPPNKVVGREANGNPTGHTIIFLGTIIWRGDQRTREVLCYVLTGGA